MLLKNIHKKILTIFTITTLIYSTLGEVNADEIAPTQEPTLSEIEEIKTIEHETIYSEYIQVDGIFYVPLRYVYESAGSAVTWDSIKKEICYTNKNEKKTVSFNNGDNFILGGTTYTNAQSFGAEFNYESISNSNELITFQKLPENVKKINIGYTGKKQPIIAYKIDNTTDPSSVKNVLLTFEMHGYEDYYDKDGQLLVDIGNFITETYRNDPMENTCFYIIPSLNPDALLYGTTKNGKGRTQISLGIDMNRDFDYYFIPNRTESRKKTLAVPFSAPESQALRDLVLSKEWFLILDFHGWLNSVNGNGTVTSEFNKTMLIRNKGEFTSYNAGLYVPWASGYSLHYGLIEYPELIAKTKDIEWYAVKTVESINKILSLK